LHLFGSNSTASSFDDGGRRTYVDVGRRSFTGPSELSRLLGKVSN
jgi:hypothetical protein